MNYYRRYPGDYMRDTAHLSILEHGAYTLLLDVCYASGKALPADYDALYRICRAMTKPEQEAVQAVADQFFPVMAEDGLRHNPRADQELDIARESIKKMSEAGRHGAEKRWGTLSAEDSPPHSVPNGVPQADPNRVPNGVKHGVTMQPPTTSNQPPAFQPSRSINQNHARPARDPVDNSTGTSKPTGNGKWWETEEATLAEATARGLRTRPGESWFDLRQRIREAPKTKFSDAS